MGFLGRGRSVDRTEHFRGGWHPDPARFPRAGRLHLGGGQVSVGGLENLSCGAWGWHPHPALSPRERVQARSLSPARGEGVS